LENILLFFSSECVTDVEIHVEIFIVLMFFKVGFDCIHRKRQCWELAIPHFSPRIHMRIACETPERRHGETLERCDVETLEHCDDETLERCDEERHLNAVTERDTITLR
jgi:hypothetical protein